MRTMRISLWLWPTLMLAWSLGYGKTYLLCLCFILLHEFAHGLVVVAWGGRIRQMHLSPMGAELILEEPLPRAMPLFLLHIAGPLCNGILAFLLACAYLITGFRDFGLMCSLNCCLTIFNLLPLYPLDGGKLTMLFLSESWGYGRSFRILYFFSCIFSVFLFLLGIYLVQYNSVNLFLCIMALQCFLQARNNRRYMIFRMEKNHRQKCDDPQLSRLTLCYEDELALHLLEQVPMRQQRDFSVVDRSGKLRGLLREDDLWSGLYRQGYDTSAEQLLRYRDRNKRNGEQ